MQQLEKNGGKRSNLKHFGSCEFPPVYLRKNQEDMPTILLFPPAPLHINLLGAASDAIENGEEKFPVEFKDEFYPKFNLKKSGEGVGGKFAGPSIKKILEQEVLNELESVLPNSEYAQDLTDYLKTVRNLHQMCTAKDLKDYESVIEDFRTKFMVMFEKHDLSWTLKIHVILDHYSFYFKKTKKTLRHTNDEFPESAHSTLRKSEETHGFKIVRTIGSPIHQQASLNSITFINSKNIGYVAPIKMRKSSPRPSPSSSSYSSPSSSPLARSSPHSSPSQSTTLSSSPSPLARSSPHSSPMT